jgi:hypothetical protein
MTMPSIYGHNTALYFNRDLGKSPISKKCHITSGCKGLAVTNILAYCIVNKNYGCKFTTVNFIHRWDVVKIVAA